MFNWKKLVFPTEISRKPRKEHGRKTGKRLVGMCSHWGGFQVSTTVPEAQRELAGQASSPATAPSPCAGNTPHCHSDPSAFLVSGSELQAPPWGLPVGPHVWPATPCCRLIRVCTPGPQFPLPSPTRADFPRS